MVSRRIQHRSHSMATSPNCLFQTVRRLDEAIHRPAVVADDVVEVAPPPAARPRVSAAAAPRVPAPRLPAPMSPASQPVKRSQPQPAAADKENQLLEAAPARKAAPVKSGLEAPDFGSQPAPKRQKRSAGLQVETVVLES